MKRTLEKIKRFFGNLPIQTKLIVIMIGLVFLSVVSLATYFYKTSSTLILDNSRHYIQNTMSQIGKNIDHNIESIDKVLFDISTNREIQERLKLVNQNKLDAYEEVEVGNDIKNKLISQITKESVIGAAFLYRLDGTVYVTKDTNYPEPSELPQGVIFDAKGSNVWFDPDPSISVIPVGKMIYSLTNQKPLGYIILYVDAEYIENVFQNIVFTKNDQIFLVNSDGGILLGDSGGEPFSIELLSDKQGDGLVRRVRIADVNKQVCSVALKNVDWMLVSISEDEKYNEQLRNLQQITIGLLVLILAVITVLSIWVARGISRPVKELANAMGQFAKGDFDIHTTEKYNDEVGQLHKSFNKMVTDMKSLVHDVYEEKSLKQQAQIKALQMQINPHFLYNTLDTIHWLANLHQETDIAEVSRSLGYLMRFSLREEELVSFEEELDAVEAYMRIQKYRYGDSLKIDIDVEEEVLYENVPRHIMLPLIENGIEHGLSKKQGEKQIRITGRMLKESILIKISDNGIGMNEETVRHILEDPIDRKKGKHMSIGVQNVHKRLKLRFGESFGLRIQSREQEGTCVTIEIPIEEENHEIL